MQQYDTKIGRDDDGVTFLLRWRVPISSISAVIVALVGLIVLTGWFLDVTSFKSLMPGWVAMKVNTALCFVLAGLALLLTSISVKSEAPGQEITPQQQLPDIRKLIAANLCALVVTLAGLLTFAEYLFGVDIGIDQLVHREPAGASETLYPGRMAIPTALNFFFIGLALLLTNNNRGRIAAQFLVLISMLIAFLAFAGYLLDFKSLVAYGPGLTPIAMHTDITFVILCIGVFMVLSHGGIAARLLRHRMAAGLVFALAVLFLVGIAFAQNSRLLLRNERMVKNTIEVLSALNALFSGMQDVQSSVRGFAISGNDSLLEPYSSALTRTEGLQKELRRLISDNPDQQERVDVLESLIKERAEYSHDTLLIYRGGNIKEAMQRISSGDGQQIMDKMRKCVRDIAADANALLEKRQVDIGVSTRKTVASLSVGAFISFCILMSVFHFLSREISDRKRTEQALQQEKIFVDTISDSLPGPFYLLDAEGRFIRSNKSMERITGLSSARLLQMNLPDVICSEDRPLVSGKIHEVFSKGYADAEARVQSSDGVLRLFFFTGTRMDVGGKAFLVGSGTDMTARKQAEEDRDRFFSLTLDILCISNADGYFKRVNPAFSQVLGWSAGELLKMPYLDLVHPDDIAATIREVDRQVKAGEQVLQFENRYRHKNGSWRVLSWKSVPQPGGFMYATARDVTELKRAEETLKRLNVELEQRVEELSVAHRAAELASNAKSDFLASMSHELRTPLNAVIGFSQILREEYYGCLNEKQKGYVDDILESGRHLLSLINDILNLAKIEAGHADLNLSPVRVQDLVGNALVMVKEKAHQHGLEISTGMDEELQDRVVVADERKLKQILFNLLSNAAKFTPDGGKIRVEARIAGEDMLITVTDTGIGIPPEKQALLFQKFTQLHDTLTDKTSGTGLGLALCRELVQLHGGRIWAESEGKDRGSRFSFVIPLNLRKSEEGKNNG